MKYTVIRDSREHDGEGWVFEGNSACEGTVVKPLKTGDYTIVGFDTQFVIERKKSMSEFAGNLCQDRFERELQRLEKFQFPFIILEFNMDDVIRWPPFYLRNKVKTNGSFILRRLLELQVQYKTKIIFAGTHGKDVASSLFKRIVEYYERDKSGRLVGKTTKSNERTVGRPASRSNPRRVSRGNT